MSRDMLTKTYSINHFPFDFQVQFKDEADLVQIIEFEDDPQAREDRSYWKFFFINQARFKDRICQTEEALGNIFSLAHRDKVYTERILPFQQNHEIGGEIQNRSGGELIKLSRHSCIEDSTTKWIVIKLAR